MNEIFKKFSSKKNDGFYDIENSIKMTDHENHETYSQENSPNKQIIQTLSSHSSTPKGLPEASSGVAEFIRTIPPTTNLATMFSKNRNRTFSKIDNIHLRKDLKVRSSLSPRYMDRDNEIIISSKKDPDNPFALLKDTPMPVGMSVKSRKKSSDFSNLSEKISAKFGLSIHKIEDDYS